MLERRREGAVELPPAAAVSTKRFVAQLAGADELDRLAAPA